jgi:hypothetical protein
VHSILTKACDEKDFFLIGGILKDLSALFQEYNNTTAKAEYFESHKSFVHLQKKLAKLSSVLDKDWRNYEQFLQFVLSNC